MMMMMMCIYFSLTFYAYFYIRFWILYACHVDIFILAFCFIYICIYIYIYIYILRLIILIGIFINKKCSILVIIHHHDMPLAQISLTLSRHFSQSFIASGRSSGLHPVSSHSCWMYVRAGCPAFAWPYAGVHRSTSLRLV